MANPALAKFVLDTLLARGHLQRGHRVLAVCAGQFDRRLFEVVGMPAVTLTNLDVEHGSRREGEQAAGDATWLQADAHDLPFDDGEFDVAWVSDGLHHCHSPHRALAEMHRVSRRCVIALESRDSMAMRVATRLGVVHDYEANQRLLHTRQHGGKDFGPVPNFVYRWTEREFTKTMLALAPERRMAFDYFHALRLPPRSGRVVRTVGEAVFRMAPGQGNSLGMVARRGDHQPWLATGDGGLRLADDVTTRADVVGPRPRVHHHVLRETDRWHGWPPGQRVDVDDH